MNPTGEKNREQRDAEWAAHALEQAQQRREEEGKPQAPQIMDPEERAAYKRAGEYPVWVKLEETERRAAKAEAGEKKEVGAARKRKKAEKPKTVEEQLAEIQKSLVELKLQNEQLREEKKELHKENEKLREHMQKAQEVMQFRSSVEAQSFVQFWAEKILKEDYIVSLLASPGYGFYTTDRGAMMWRLPDIIASKLRAEYGSAWGTQGTEGYLLRDIHAKIIDTIVAAQAGYRTGAVVSYPAIPGIVAGRDIHVANIYGSQAGAGVPATTAPQVPLPETETGLTPQPAVAVPTQEQAREAGEEVEKRVEETLEAPEAEVLEQKRAPEVERAPEAEAEQELPKDIAVSKALDDLLRQYSLDKGYGKWRQGIGPLVAGIASSGASVRILEAVAVGASAPVMGAVSGVAFSLGGSLIRRFIGKENSFSLWARYSHVEGKGIKKVLQLFTRGLERMAIKSALKLDGSKQVQEMIGWYNWTTIPKEKLSELKSDPGKLSRYLEEGLWYLLANQAVIGAGAYLNETEQQKWQYNEARVSAILNQLLVETGNDFNKGAEKDNAIALLQSVEKKIQDKEDGVYWKSAWAMGGAAALKGAFLGGLFSWVGHKIHDLTSSTAPIGGGPVSGEPAGGAPVGQTPGGQVSIEGLGNTVPVKETLGHTFQDAGFNANLLWREGPGTVILRKIGELNAGNENMWKQLWWFATESKGLAPGTMNHLRELLIRAGVDGIKGDFIADPSIFGPAKLSYKELLDIFRYTGKAVGVEASELGGRALQVTLPDATFVGEVSSGF